MENNKIIMCADVLFNYFCRINYISTYHMHYSCFGKFKINLLNFSVFASVTLKVKQ